MTTPNNLRSTTLDLLELVQTVSGFPAVVQANPELSTTAALSMARGQRAVHVIEYNPALVREPDYHVAVQCGYILRFFAPPPAERKDLADDLAGLEKVRDLVRQSTGQRMPGLSPVTLEHLAERLYRGLMLQLRSMPIELRVEAWIAEAYPEYAATQRAVVLGQLDVNARALSEAVRAASPGRVFKASVTMNAAVAQYWVGELLLPDLVKPYAREGLAAGGAQLLAIWRRVSADAVHDRELIDAWAHALKIGGWYAWVPYDAPAMSRP